MGSLLSTPHPNPLDFRLLNVLLTLLNRPDVAPTVMNSTVLQDLPGALRFSHIIGNLGITVSHAPS